MLKKGTLCVKSGTPICKKFLLGFLSEKHATFSDKSCCKYIGLSCCISIIYASNMG